jgi:hypothetical protein
MNLEQTKAWFEQLAANRPKQHLPTKVGPSEYRVQEITAWGVEVESALHSTFPEGHPIRKLWQREWTAFLENSGGLASRNWELYIPTKLYPCFDSAKKMLEDGRLSSLIAGVKAETLDELLDQAAALLNSGQNVAATVIAGGALETHLRHLCGRHNIQWTGNGSISKYNDVIAQARKNGTEVYSASDVKHVTAWGGLRNEAAHTPQAFSATNTQIEQMIGGVREFIKRTL